jgi:hypothetical protein
VRFRPFCFPSFLFLFLTAAVIVERFSFRLTIWALEAMGTIFAPLFLPLVLSALSLF